MFWSKFKHNINQDTKGSIAIAFLISGLVIAVNTTGIYQSLEWSTLDFWFRLRSREANEERIVVVDITESDINNPGKSSSTDGVLVQLVNKIRQQQPRVIGLDLDRDLHHIEHHIDKKGRQELAQALKSIPNLIGAEKLVDRIMEPSPILKAENSVNTGDFVLDRDGKVRRALISIKLDNCQITLGLAAKLATTYLEKAGIELEAGKKAGTLRLGKSILPPIKNNEGGYINLDVQDYQILLNSRRGKEQFLHTSLREVLNDSTPKSLFRDRIVLIGFTSTSLNDLFYTPESLIKSNYLPRVYIHANIISQIISGALDGRLMLRGIVEFGEWLWVFAWSIAGTSISLILLEKNLLQQNTLIAIILSILGIFILIVILLGSSYLLFLSGWWLPAIAPLFALTNSSVVGILYHSQKQKRIAFTDGLTGIPNRRLFDRYLEQQWAKCQRERKDISLIFGDVDFFKVYNDTYGHLKGDRCLQKIALIIYSSVRKSDLAARYGGEEFVIVLPNTSLKMSLVIAERIRANLKAMEIPHQNSQVSNQVSISMGIASAHHNHVISPEELIAAADKGLCLAKKQGRDRVIIHEGN